MQLVSGNWRDGELSYSMLGGEIAATRNQCRETISTAFGILSRSAIEHVDTVSKVEAIS